MKIIKTILLFMLICSLSYFSWTYKVINKFEQKLERATLVIEQCNIGIKESMEG